MTQQDRDDALDALGSVIDGRPLTTAEVARVRKFILSMSEREFEAFVELIGGSGPATLLEAVEFYRAWRVVGRSIRLFIVAFGMLAAAIAAWDVVVAKVRAAWLG